MSVIERMLEHCESLDEKLAKIKPDAAQEQMIARMAASVESYRTYLAQSGGFFERHRPFNFEPPALTPLKLRDNAVTTPLPHGLGEDQIRQFTEEGVIGPFDLLSTDEADRLCKRSWELNESGFKDNFLLGDAAKQALLKTNATINSLGLYQSLNYSEYWNLLSRPEITDKLAALLGPDLLMWRSQFFAKPPQTKKGTFWHCASSFRELATKPKLTPAPGVAGNMIQLTVWIALTDFSPRVGCMRFMPRSFNDHRLEQYPYYFQDEFIALLARMPQEEVYRALKTFFFSDGIFDKSHYVFEDLVRRRPDVFDAYEIKDMTVKRGQFIIFSSQNAHCAYGNHTDQPLLSIAGRYTTNDTKIFDGLETDSVATTVGLVPYPVDRLGSIQVRGRDTFGHNLIVPAPYVG